MYLPYEKQLASQYGVSLWTVRKALSELEQRGFVKTLNGKGTIVIKPVSYTHLDKSYQNRGYGKKAVELALRFIRTFPCGKADSCWLSYEPENTVAKSLYASFGFIETGEKDGETI